MHIVKYTHTVVKKSGYLLNLMYIDKLYFNIVINFHPICHMHIIFMEQPFEKKT